MTMLQIISMAFVLMFAAAAGWSYDIGLNGLCFVFGTSAFLLTLAAPYIAKDFP